MSVRVRNARPRASDARMAKKVPYMTKKVPYEYGITMIGKIKETFRLQNDLEMEISKKGEGAVPFPQQETNDCYLASTNRLIALLSHADNPNTAYAGATTRTRVSQWKDQAIAHGRNMVLNGDATENLSGLTGSLEEYLPKIMFRD